VLREKAVDNTVAGLEISSRKPLKQLMQETCFKHICTKGHRTAKTATYKTMVVHALKKHDLVARIHFYNWFLWYRHDLERDQQLVFSYEAWFSSHGQMNSQTISTAMQKTQYLFTKFLFVKNKSVFGLQYVHTG
jgi:hypothetical protein